MTRGEWNTVQLNSICSPDRTTLRSNSEEASTRPYLGLELVESETGNINESGLVTNAETGTSITFAFDERHVLYGKLRPYLNKVALPDFAGRCTTELIPLLPAGELDRKYLAWFLRRPETVDAAMMGKTGSRMPRANMKDLMQLMIPLPPMAEQRRIAARLDNQMAHVARARAAAQTRLAAAKALSGAMLRVVFEGGDSAQWPRRRLGELMTVRNEIIHPRDNPEGGATFVGLEHIESGTGKRVGARQIEMRSLTGRKPKFYENDIVYGYLRPYLNKVWIAEFDGLCSVDQYVYRLDTAVADAEFVSSFMRSSVFLARAPIDITPGQLPRIRKEEVASVAIGLPVLKKQRRIVTELSECMGAAEQLRGAAETELAAIVAMPAALLRKAFNGAH